MPGHTYYKIKITHPNPVFTQPDPWGCSLCQVPRCGHCEWPVLETKSPELREILYKAIVRPQLEYAARVWDPYIQEDIQRIEMIQRRAAWWVLSDYLLQCLRHAGKTRLVHPGTAACWLMTGPVLQDSAWPGWHFPPNICHTPQSVFSDNPMTDFVRLCTASSHFVFDLSSLETSAFEELGSELINFASNCVINTLRLIVYLTGLSIWI